MNLLLAALLTTSTLYGGSGLWLVDDSGTTICRTQIRAHADWTTGSATRATFTPRTRVDE